MSIPQSDLDAVQTRLDSATEVFDLACDSVFNVIPAVASALKTDTLSDVTAFLVELADAGVCVITEDDLEKLVDQCVTTAIDEAADQVAAKVNDAIDEAAAALAAEFKDQLVDA